MIATKEASTKEAPAKVSTMPSAEHKALVLDDAALDAARRSLDQGAVTPNSRSTG